MTMTRLLLIALLFPSLCLAHVGTHPSVHDTVASVLERMRNELPAEALVGMTPEHAYDVLTDEERHVLATQHITFTVNVPVIVSIFRDVRQPELPFWLQAESYQQAAGQANVDGKVFEIWKKEFDAGEVGLGVNSLSGAGDHYFVGIEPQTPGDAVEITNIYPGQHTLGVLRTGAMPYSNSSAALRELPEDLEGQILLRGHTGRRREGQITNVFMLTQYPATTTPDHVVLTWHDDPRSTQALQWRTSLDVDGGAVRYQVKPAAGQPRPDAWNTVEAATQVLKNEILVNDPLCHRHTVVLSGLEPDTTYVYEISNGSAWGAAAEFATAPDTVRPFKFVYMGDAQNGLDTWGNLVQDAHQKQPDAEFYIMAGDLVNRGNERNDWDSFFHNATGIFDRRQLVPCLGNHEYQGDLGPWMYHELFRLPRNGPDTIPPERAYAFEYSNALFVILDSNLPAETQTAWLEEQLAGTDATWKFVAYHHPAYSSGPRRDNVGVRNLWGALFDKYHVDLALQGHDHAYLRTYPMHNQQRVESAAEGTIYIVSVSGTKFYEQGDYDYTEVGMTNLSTYQVLDIEIDGNKLTYKAYDIDGTVRDEFVIEK
jgi:acid phosphatase type 7